MKENVKTELNTLITILQNWKKCDIKHADPGGGNEWIYEEFVEKVSTWMMPYVTALRREEHLDSTEIEYFMERISGEISDMRRLLGLPKPDAPRKVTPIRGE